mmetsp:Transcript_4177/g.3637  ORF Transcript_4177/g.3637 Transcript_4177/m.3637 type:complete len:101 (-) Transcript_4177:684-986(-)
MLATSPFLLAGGLMRQCHIWDHGFLPLPLGTINMSSAIIHTRMSDTRTQTSHMHRRTCANMRLCDGVLFTECSTAGGEWGLYGQLESELGSTLPLTPSCS